MFLYTASKMMGVPGVRLVISTVILARTGRRLSLEANSHPKQVLPFKLTDMKAVQHGSPLLVLEPLASAVRITISCPEAGTTAATRGPLVSVV